jgi:glycosyltransferase involved in cell wall biosynthesis
MRPKVTIGLPVRNGQRHIARAIESVMAQEFTDFEMVICDNDSEDSTADVVRRYTESDPRIRLHENEHNIGQIANMKRVFDLGSGEYLRWMGHDDSLEPDYLSKTVAYLDQHPDMIGVSTYIRYFDDDGNEYYAEYTGERLDSPEPQKRFCRTLWFQRNDYRFSDPHYSLYRRSALQKTHFLQPVFDTDLLLAAELSLVGPTGHIPQCLSHRRRVPSSFDDREALQARNDPDLADEMHPSYIRLSANYNALVNAAPLTWAQRLVCRQAIARFFVVLELRVLKERARNVAKRMPGYERAKAAVGR